MSLYYIYSIPLAAGLMFGLASAPDVLAQQQPQQEQTIEQRADDVYVDLGYAPGRLNVNGSTLEEYRTNVSTILKRHRPGIERDEIGFEALVDSFARGVNRDGGSLHVIDFNNIVDDHRNYVEIARQLDSYNLDEAYTESIKRFYASSLIREGHQLNADFEKKNMI